MFMEWTLVVIQVAPGGVISGLMQDVVELLVSPSREEHVALVVAPPPPPLVYPKGEKWEW